MTDNKDINKIKIFFATPCFGAQVSCNFTNSLIQTINLLREHNIDCCYSFLPNQIVTRARNILTHRFLQTNCTHLFFIDADIDFRPTDVIEMIKNDKSICVGLYANKRYIDNKDISYTDISNNNLFYKSIQYSSTFEQNINSLENNKLIKIKHGATGFMLIKRNVLENLKTMVKSFNWSHLNNIYAFFNCEVYNNDYLTEDYYFCQLWKDFCKKHNEENPDSLIDDNIWADLSINLNHEGWNSFQGNPFKSFNVISNN